jgi:hypothetical protein
MIMASGQARAQIPQEIQAFLQTFLEGAPLSKDRQKTIIS